MKFCLLLVMVSCAVAVPTRKSGCRKASPRLMMDAKVENLLDLTHEFNGETAYWPSNPSGFSYKTLFSGFTSLPNRFFYSMGFYSQPEHLGTHMDSPIHFGEHRQAVHEVGLSSLIGPGVLINLKRNGERLDADSLITIDDILLWETQNDGRIRSGSVVLFYTGYSDTYDDRPAYYGTNMTGPESAEELRFPGLSPDAARWLITNRCIASVGIDTMSIDYGQSKTYETHRILADDNIPIFENVNLQPLAASGRAFRIIALPQKITGGTGAPTRIIAVLN